MEETLRIKIESLQNMMIEIATGRYGSVLENNYQPLRTSVLTSNEIKGQVPRLVQTNGSVAQFWGYIKQFKTYEERRQHIWQSFREVLDFVDTRATGAADIHLSENIARFNQEYLDIEWRKALDRRNSDPEGAITSSRTLIETTCKYILDRLQVQFKNDLELPKLYKLTAENLNLAPDQHTEKIFKQILGGCQAVVDGLGALRNKLSDAHGKKTSQPRPSKRHAVLAVNLAGSLTTFLLETYELRHGNTIPEATTA